MNYLYLNTQKHILPVLTDAEAISMMYPYHVSKFIPTIIKKDYMYPSNIITALRFGSQIIIYNVISHNVIIKDIILGNGEYTTSYYKNRYHSIGNLPAIDFKTPARDIQLWYQIGIQHREDGPAYISNACKKWYRNGLLHRVGLPAVEYTNGHKEWWENGKCIGVNEGLYAQYDDFWHQFGL